MTAILIILFVGLFLTLIGRFLYIQVTGEVNGVSLNDWAKEKRSANYTLDANRGSIFDRNGVTLAYDQQTYRLYAIIDDSFTLDSEDPNHVEDIEKTAKLLAPILDVEESYIEERLQTGKEEEKVQVEFGTAGKELTPKIKEDIEALNLPGIHFYSESMRHYPNGKFASHILGFARQQEDDDEVTGVIGIEKQLDDILRGKDGFISYQRDYFDNKLLDPDEIIKQPKHGNNAYLTIDQKIQVLLEDVMSEVEDEYTPESMNAMVMNAKTGEIIAMSNRPSFDPNKPKNVDNWYNDLISTPIEPGSTMKIFTWAAAIDAGVYDGDEAFKSGKYQINPSVESVRDHNNGEGWGKISFDEGFARSSNVAAAKLVWDKLGPEKFHDYLTAFHFDEKTNIDLPDEVAGKILYNWPSEKITTAFGQGSTLTPIQQMKAATAIANEGEMLEPFIIKKTTDVETDEIIEEKSRTVVDQPISKDTAKKMLNLLGDVVDSDDGTGSPYKLDSYSVGGKTGTSQIPNPDGGYLRGKENHIFSFLGMAPQDDPQLIMYVSVTKPSLEAEEAGSDPVSFIFKNVMENSLNYLNIDPDKDEDDPIEMIEIPSFENKDPKSIEEKLTSKGLEVTVVGSGDNVVQANVEPGKEVVPYQRVILLTDEPEMPDIEGWSLREVYQLADLLNLNVETIGDGYVVSQNIKEGTSIKENDYLGVELESPIDDSQEKE